MANNNIGNNIKQLRKTARLTQEQLAEKSGLSLTFISRLEYSNQNVSLVTLDKIANALRVNLSELVGDDGYEDKDDDIEKLRSLLYSIDRKTAKHLCQAFIEIVKIK